MNIITMERALALVADERHKQQAKWGDQNHANVHPAALALGGDGDPTTWHVAAFYEIPTALRAKFKTGKAAMTGEDTWADILIEEVAEAIEAATIHDLRLLTDEQTRRALRDELVQVAAVAVQWIEKLDTTTE
ncbi:hypothetical protein SEA_ILLUMINE_63 [Mycobacterium phage Illumine]|nr:hypothetical protein SEA_DOLE_63 [Mycobacterium phage Dole]UDL14736.1 hypothetical protein SEA_DEVERA_65 [Mycobacterium phage Devera]UDL15000.1 hypothetical protein SEA_ILLUMINE_63 [Mycobacterium phage Illumine]